MVKVGKETIHGCYGNCSHQHTCPASGHRCISPSNHWDFQRQWPACPDSGQSWVVDMFMQTQIKRKPTSSEILQTRKKVLVRFEGSNLLKKIMCFIFFRWFWKPRKGYPCILAYHSNKTFQHNGSELWELHLLSFPPKIHRRHWMGLMHLPTFVPWTTQM